MSGYVYTDFDFLETQMLQLARELCPSETRKFLNREATKGRKILKQNTKAAIGSRVNPTNYRKLGAKGTGNLLRGSKKGRVFKYRGDPDAMQVRVKNAAPHAHLFEYGHEVYIAGHPKGRKAREAGYVSHGHDVLGRTAKQMQTEFNRDASAFVDDLLRRGFR